LSAGIIHSEAVTLANVPAINIKGVGCDIFYDYYTTFFLRIMQLGRFQFVMVSGFMSGFTLVSLQEMNRGLSVWP
jgi:hypothetical protein